MPQNPSNEHISSRRTVLKGLVVSSAVAAGGRSAFAAAASPDRTWGFGTPNVDWQPIEIATGDTLLVSAGVAGTPVRAVLDSGSGASIINTAFAIRLGLSNGEPRTISGLSGKAPVRLVRNVDVTFGGEVRRLPIAVEASLAALSAAFGRTIDMLLGADMLDGRCVALDFEKRRFAVTASGSFVGGPAWTRIPLLHGAKKELFVLVSVAGLPPAPLMFDLGSSAALMLSSTYLNAHGITSGKATSTAALGGVEGVRIVRTFTVEKVLVGAVGASSVPTLGIDNWLSADTVGNIGLPLIAQFDLVLDITAGALWLLPISARNRLPMLKDRSGLGLSASADALAVVHVAVNSPAEKAGWKVGERIVAVNDNPIDAAYTHGELWRWRFMRAGTAVVLKDSAGRARSLQLADYY